MKRRDFLRVGGLSAAFGLVQWGCRGPAGALDPVTAQAAAQQVAGTTPARFGERPVVLVELNGGNDGLNTVVPYTHDRYYGARPNLAIARDEVVDLDGDVGFNPALASWMPLWEAGQLAVVQGVGYAAPNRSHFRSIEIWETGAASDEVLEAGWIDRAVGQATALAADGVVIGHAEPGPLAGDLLRVVSMDRPADFVAEAQRLSPVANPGGNAALEHVIGVHNEVIASARQIETRLDATSPPDVAFPNTRIGRQLEVAARLITAGVPVGVLKVQHGSFDTHANQRGPHDRLLGQLADALAAFHTALEAADRWRDTLVMTYSEFGRRVAENGSGGTDHGTAAPHFLLGGAVQGGVYGEHPALDALAGGDLVHTVDYRALYNTVATRWWGLDAPFADIDELAVV